MHRRTGLMVALAVAGIAILAVTLGAFAEGEWVPAPPAEAGRPPEDAQLVVADRQPGPSGVAMSPFALMSSGGAASLSDLISSGLERDGSGAVARVFGFDPAMAKEVLFPVTKHRSLRADYAPRDLVAPGLFGVEGTKPVRRLLGPDLAAMQRASGGALREVSGYRSFGRQTELFGQYQAKEMAAGATQETAEVLAHRYSAYPGHSQHQLGLAVDFNSLEVTFGDTPTGRWLKENAWKYGFVMSYTPWGEARSGYQYEPWHYRWVGRPLAKLMWEQDYLNDSQRVPDDYLEAIWIVLEGS